MYTHYFPSCPVDSPIEPPVPFGHVGLSGAVPKKCSKCRHLFEGECTRFIEEVGRFLHLDHGPCGIDGPTDPVEYEDEFVKGKVTVPRKCSRCFHLAVDPVYGFHCTKDATKWGHAHRSLDWGAWRPDHVYLQLPPPKVTTKALSEHTFANDQLAFIKEHRRINPGLSIQEAKADFAHFRRVIEESER
ncbi:hypothetical protein [Aeoliella mucimassa]|uniref:hypothetical protein n=1 Tax=Aeoliella mucimassa TaxID=2527972 RepID=UPI0011AAA3BA|nr:hypothetical protein [Aeoliella mucimassa]